MSWIFWLWSPQAPVTPVVVVLATILILDIFVWVAAKRILARKQHHDGIIDHIMSFLGSWGAFFLMAVVSIGWALYDFSGSRPDGTLDIVISIWTMLLDSVVIISMVYGHERDKKLLKDIYDEIRRKK